MFLKLLIFHVFFILEAYGELGMFEEIKAMDAPQSSGFSVWKHLSGNACKTSSFHLFKTEHSEDPQLFRSEFYNFRNISFVALSKIKYSQPLQEIIQNSNPNIWKELKESMSDNLSMTFQVMFNSKILSLLFLLGKLYIPWSFTPSNKFNLKTDWSRSFF